jgi:hypothetical protein
MGDMYGVRAHNRTGIFSGEFVSAPLPAFEIDVSTGLKGQGYLFGSDKRRGHCSMKGIWLR